MTMQSIALGDVCANGPLLGFGCSAMMGRVGRKASLEALAAAYDEGVIFYDTARSYGYGESEALLGEFLRGRREKVLVSTKFGILPASSDPLKRALKPVARTLMRWVPGVRTGMQRQLRAMSSGGHFSVGALHASLDTSLRALRTNYVDFLFLHEPEASVFQQDDLFAALRKLVAAGKVRRFGIASSQAVVEAAIDARVLGLQAVQFPCNLLNFQIPQRWLEGRGELVSIANHPFGGAAGISACKTLLTSLASSGNTPTVLREKMGSMDDLLLADAVLNTISRGTGVQVVVPSMLRLDHLRANVEAMRRSRFSSEELGWLRQAIVARSGT